MHNSIIPVQALTQTEGPVDWKFLGGLIDIEDLEGESMKLYTSFSGDCEIFTLNKDRVKFAGAIGIKSYNRWYQDPDSFKDAKGKAVELILWPRMPAKDLRRGEMDVFDPHAILNLVWMFKEISFEEKALLTLLWMEMKMKHDRLSFSSAGYAIQLLSKARELWPLNPT